VVCLSPVLSDQTLLKKFCTVELQFLVLSYAVVNQNVHATILPDDVTEGVANLMTKGWHYPGPGGQFNKAFFYMYNKKEQMKVHYNSGYQITVPVKYSNSSFCI
jgi:hypothetical protein